MPKAYNNPRTPTKTYDYLYSVYAIMQHTCTSPTNSMLNTQTHSLNVTKTTSDLSRTRESRYFPRIPLLFLAFWESLGSWKKQTLTPCVTRLTRACLHSLRAAGFKFTPTKKSMKTKGGRKHPLTPCRSNCKNHETLICNSCSRL